MFKSTKESRKFFANCYNARKIVEIASDLASSKEKTATVVIDGKTYVVVSLELQK